MKANAILLPKRGGQARMALLSVRLALLLSLIPLAGLAATNEVTPRLVSLGFEDDGSVDFEVTVPERSVIRLEATTDFKSWSCVATQTIWQNIECFRIEPAPEAPTRFFRLTMLASGIEDSRSDPTLEAEATAATNRELAKVIYGADDRRDVYQEQDPLRLRLAAATCGLVYADELHDLGDGTCQILTAPYMVSGLPPCDGERFATQPTGPYCTGFLVGDDLVATAGHCFDAGDIGDVRFVFGFQMLDVQTPVRVFSADRVFTGLKLLGWVHENTGADYAIIRLDRPVRLAGVAPLVIRRSDVPAVGTPLGVIGHPHGLPLKLAFGDMTQVTAVRDSFLVANLDTYGGNSGSPVFNAADGTVEGILVRGRADYVASNGCFRSNQLADSPGAEDVTLAATFAHLVPTTDLRAVWVDFAYSGVEAGTEDHPFRTLGRAAAVAAAGATIYIKAGSGRETLTLNRPARLEAIGGTVRIGG